MRLQRKSNLKKARIEIIPMIDTIFFLLVFFMISTLSMSRFTGVSLTDIPRVEPEPAPAPKPEPKKVEKIKAPRLIHKTDIARVEPNEPKREELPPPPPNLTASGPEKGNVASQKQAGEAAGEEAGVGGLFGGGDVSVTGGSGIGGGGRGTADAGLGTRDKGDGFGGGGSGNGLAALARPLGGYQVKPRYPESARRAGAQGVTLLRVRVLENGRVGEVVIEVRRFS